MEPLTCNRCGKEMCRVARSRPQGEARCQDCRRAESLPTGPRASTAKRNAQSFVCIMCGADFPWTQNSRHKFCSNKCVGAYRRAQHIASNPVSLKPYFVRRERESRSPGLSAWQRRALLKVWVRQGRRCTYCSKPANSVDHVVPLMRGGTNHEGNLTPACKSCNSAKGARTVMEWRTGKVAADTSAATWTRKIPRRSGPVPKPKTMVAVAMQFDECALCHGLYVRNTTRQRYCSPECSTEANRINCRMRMRAKLGIPRDAPPYNVASRAS